MTVALVLLAAGFLLAPAAAARHDHRVRGRLTRLRPGPSPAVARPIRWPRTRKAEAADGRLPVVAELLAACLATGASPAAAAAAVGGSLDGPLAEGLRRAVTELRLGAEPSAAWGRLGALPGAAGLARSLELADTSGVPAGTAIGREATEFRARRTRDTVIRTRRAAVHITGPLGLCFLPAFLLIGVAPVVIGLLRTLW
ncbi:type II secretion system F family protein [Streptomyces sp. ACA25]|uniref:type II secretion system F family protein n=1 Tax=Streptomyces sp. ACA25 TaxID=3022596 RepID=UPI002307E22B|nr:type II secretion system F family protein [Streptomyces sp. ACA25]MDB1086524.1 type II secretion system F family protein [Streptomyces sp. ACA25]